MHRVHGNTVMYPGSRGPSVRPASQLAAVDDSHQGPGDLRACLACVGRHQLGRAETHLGLTVYWRICPRILRISYPYLRLSCAFPIHGRICLCDPPTSTPAEEEKAQEPTIRPDLGASPPAVHPLRFALLQLAEHGASCDFEPRSQPHQKHKYHGRSGVTKPETATPRQVTQMQADGADGTGGYLGGARQRRHQH